MLSNILPKQLKLVAQYTPFSSMTNPSS